jgi:hypothetical protein
MGHVVVVQVGNGFELTNDTNGVNFDLDSNGRSIRSLGLGYFLSSPSPTLMLIQTLTSIYVLVLVSCYSRK